jgi:hypothetical protein
MNKQSGISQENKSNSVENRITQKKKGNESTFLLADNRSEIIAQRKLFLMANNSPQVNQLRIIQGLGDNTIQRMGWTWDGTIWTPDIPDTTIAPPARTGKGNYEYFDDGLGDGQAKVIQPPKGYVLSHTRMGNQSAYVQNPKNYVITKLAMDHIIEVANGDEAKEHRSEKMKGNSSPTYVHPGDDELYTYRINGKHEDGIPMISVLEQGKVRGGMHKF